MKLSDLVHSLKELLSLGAQSYVSGQMDSLWERLRKFGYVQGDSLVVSRKRFPQFLRVLGMSVAHVLEHGDHD